MKPIFNIEEIFDIAIQMEKNGAEFYNNAKDNTDDAETKQFLSELILMEKEHEKLFVSMKNEIHGDNNSSAYYDPDGDAALYLKTYVNNQVFKAENGIEGLLNGNESFKEVLKIAVKLQHIWDLTIRHSAL